MKFLIITFIIGFLSNSCIDCRKGITEGEMQAIAHQCNGILGQCFKSYDAEKLALMYTDSAKLCPNGYDFVVGREKIRTFWAKDFKTSRVIDMNTQVITVDGTSDVIYETGISESKILYNDSIYHVRVKYINVWRKQPDGTYLLDVDFWNKPGL